MIAGLIKAKRNYNPSLVSTGEGFLLAYRSEPEDFRVSEIVLADLDAAHNVLRNQRLKVPNVPAGCSLEDPRLFWFAGDLYIAFSIAKYGASDGWKCVQAYGRLARKGRNWTLPTTWVPRYGANDWSGKEKNWTFFEAEGALRCIYDMGAAGWTVLELADDLVVNEWRHPAPTWRWGRMSGGTPAVDWEGQKLTVFHSWERHGLRHRIYHMGFLAFDAVAPHAPRMVSTEPVLTAKEEWGRPDSAAGWQPLCVFPGGLEAYGSKALISYGRNDLDAAIGVFRIDRLKPVASRRNLGREQRIRLLGNVMLNGRQTWAGTEVSVLSADAASLIARGKAVPL
jgi:predicted GH43/DUF377 family glycosyl hydrolase